MRPVICLSTQFWSDLHTNKQHLMDRLATRGHPVLYVEPAAHDAPTDRTVAYTPLRLLYPSPTIRKTKPNLWIYSHALLPLRRLAFSRNFNRHQEDHVLPRVVTRWMNRQGWNNPLLWFYRPEAISILSTFPGSPRLYDCVDDLATFPSYHSSEPLTLLVGREALLVDKADLVVVTSPSLKEIFTRRAHHLASIGNVADYKHFAGGSLVNGEHPLWHGVGGRRLLFVGALNPLKVDILMLRSLAGALPQDTIMLAGPISGDNALWDDLRQFPNVRFTGLVPYGDLPQLMHGADVALIPYNCNQYTTSCFPIKFYEYLAAGLPVVSSRLPALSSGEDSDLIHFYTDLAGMVFAIDAAFKLKVTGQEERRDRASHHTWEDRLNRILKELTSLGVEMA